MTPLRAVSFRLVALAGGALVALAVAEGAARLVWEAPWYERLLAEQAAAQALPYRLNSLGLRDREPAPRREDTARVLVLGDSFTFGQGVAPDDAVFPRRLERELDRPERRVEVLNGGIPGSRTSDWLRLWRRIGPSWEPDAVLMVFFLRDGTRIASISEALDRIRSAVRRNRASRVYRASALWRWWRDRRDRRWVADGYTQVFRTAYLGAPEETAEWRRAQANLRRIAREARSRGAAVGFAVFPVLVELNRDYPFREIVDHLVAWGHGEELATHDLLPAFLGRDAASLWVSPLDQHPNARGHAIAAESLLPFAERLLADAAAAAEARHVNGCDPARAADRRGAAQVEIHFGGRLGYNYDPSCLIVDAGARIAFSGEFELHPLAAGRIVQGLVEADPGSPIRATGTGERAVFRAEARGRYGFYCDHHVADGMAGAVFVQ